MTMHVPIAVPLVVDVDGTLVRGDLLHEAALQFVARHPFQTWRLAAWLLRGKAALKEELSARVNPGIDSVPLRAETLAAIDAARAAGRPVVLASASHQRWVDAIAARVDGAEVMASDAHLNLAGHAKAAALVERFGEGGFDYAGDGYVDLPVWAAARRRLVVSHDDGLERTVRRHFPDAELIARDRPASLQQLRALRMHQWAKNLLVFLPLVAGHDFTPAGLLAAVAAFVAFSAAASSAYLVNDLLDLPGDRDHPRKRYRPFAAGLLSPVRGLAMAATLMAGAFAVAALLPGRFVVVLGGYVVLTLAYSLVLKRHQLVDIIVLAGLYAIRVLGGVAALHQMQSPWLLMFSLFLFLSLAAVKRCSELVARRAAGKCAPPGRGYRIEDLAVLFPLAAAAGYGAVLVVTLYLSSPEVARLYTHPSRMWLICPLLLYWISRVLMLSNRDELHDDPVIFALTDRVSWLVGALVAGVIAASV